MVINNRDRVSEKSQPISANSPRPFEISKKDFRGTGWKNVDEKNYDFVCNLYIYISVCIFYTFVSGFIKIRSRECSDIVVQISEQTREKNRKVER